MICLLRVSHFAREMEKGGKGRGGKGGKAGGGAGRKGKGGGKDKTSLTDRDLQTLREWEKKKAAAKIVARRTTAEPVPRWVKGFRTPLDLRYGHIRPKELTKRSLHQSVAIKKSYVEASLGATIKGWISNEVLEPQHLQLARTAAKEWMDRRFISDTRLIENIQHERGRRQLCKTKLWESGPCFDEFEGNAACTFPESFENQVVLDLHLLDFDPNRWQPFKDIEGNRKWWMQWHGTNFYALSTILAYNFLSPSRSEKHGQESMLSQGIYSSHFFEASAHFATPLVFTRDMLPPTHPSRGVGPSSPDEAAAMAEKGYFVPALVKPMLLILVPGDASTGGAGIYHQLPCKWIQIDGQWDKFDLWQIDKLPDDYKINPLFGQPTEEFTYKKYYNVDPAAPNTMWRPSEAFNARKNRDPAEGKLSFTNLSNWSDQCVSSQAHILGVAFVYTGMAGHKKHCSADRRKNLFFGWKPEVEAPYGRPLDEWEQQFDMPVDHPHYEAQQARKAEASSGSGAASSGLGGKR